MKSINSNKLLTVVLPVRMSSDRQDVLERIQYISCDNLIPDQVDFIVVDDGSDEDSSKKIKDLCKRINISYEFIDSEFSNFSVGRARNVAAQVVKSKYIMFQDIDLIPFNGFYQKVLQECKVQELDKYADRFIMIGVAYLTENATQEFFNTPSDIRYSKFIDYLISANTGKFEKFSTGTSVTVWRRDHYLCTGGNDPDFEGWGYEDLEYACRSIRRNRKFPLPDAFFEDYKNFSSIAEYSGWKSVYRLYGDVSFAKGLLMFHSWHPVDNNSNYSIRKRKNQVIFEKKIRDFAKFGLEPKPLVSRDSGKTLLFRKNPWVINKWIAPNLGEILILNEEDYSVEQIHNFIYENKVDRVVFHNPYSTEKMREIYLSLKEKNFPYLVIERGALRDSVFIDKNGFNADSKSYSSELWDFPLSIEKRSRVLDYIRSEKADADSLEDQSEMISQTDLRNKLSIKEWEKVIFIPLQRPTDTVIKYFSDEIGGFQGFKNLIQDVVKKLPAGWRVVAKRHPLEVEEYELENVIFANDENIKSLIELSDAVLLINSGVGVLSMIYEKPTFVAGKAFYDHLGITFRVKSADDLIENLSVFRPDKEKTLRFLSYLINDFYSFAKFKTRKVAWEAGAFMTATTGIDYYVLRFPGKEEMRLECSVLPTVSSKSMIFDRYRGLDGALRVKKSHNKKDSVKPIVQNNAEKTFNTSTELEILEPSLSLRNKKIKKFKESPKRFFSDSKNPIFKAFSKLI